MITMAEMGQGSSRVKLPLHSCSDATLLAYPHVPWGLDETEGEKKFMQEVSTKMQSVTETGDCRQVLHTVPCHMLNQNTGCGSFQTSYLVG